MTYRQAHTVRRMRDNGVPISEIAQKFGISRSTVYRTLKALEAEQ